MYRGKPTTVSSSSTDGYSKIETLGDSGWLRLNDHPANIHAHKLIGMDSGSLMMIGGYVRQTDDYVTDIWVLENDSWAVIGNLQKVQVQNFGYSEYLRVLHMPRFCQLIHQSTFLAAEEIQAWLGSISIQFKGLILLKEFFRMSNLSEITSSIFTILFCTKFRLILSV